MAEPRGTRGEAYKMSGKGGEREMALAHEAFTLTWPATSQQFLIG